MVDFICDKCAKASLCTLPFVSLNDSNLSVLLNKNTDTIFSDNVRLTPPESKKIFYETCNSVSSPISNDNDDDPNEHFLTIDSKYYDIDDFNDKSTDKTSTFSLAHLNIASLNKHIDDLHSLISLLKSPFDIIAVSEHKFGVSVATRNYRIPDYSFCYDETKSSHGGTGFYISDDYNFKKRDDLKMESPGELESTFVEILIPNKPNFIC